MKKIILIQFLIFTTILNSQRILPIDNTKEKTKIFSFYVRIPNTNNLPTILSKSSEGVFIRHNNTKSQSIFNKYKVYDFIQAFPTAKTQSLKETYLVKVNDIRLMSELRNILPNIYTFSEQINDEPVLLSSEYNNSTFYIPNDYGLELAQTDLDLINAQQAWDYTTGNPNIKLGVVDTGFDVSHPELLGTITATGVNSSHEHGTSAAFNMAANTNNAIGLASIGNNCYIEARTGLSLNNCLLLSQDGIKVINGSWLNSCSFLQAHQNIINEIHDNGTVLVFAAGNTTNCGGNSNVVYPAAYNHVIAVTSIHHKNFMQPAYDDFGNYTGDVLRKIDTHDNSNVNGQKKDGSHNHTYVVDIAAPGYEVPSISRWYASGYGPVNGTSNAAPVVTGTIGLMKSVNSNLTVKEIESILKLTSANIYDIPENINYIDKLGAGRLDAGKAVEMAYKMAQPNDFIDIEDRDFYRDWAFEIKNAPYGIKISNEKFRDSIKVDFTAKNFIEIENSIIEPNSLGYSILSIDPNIPIPSMNRGFVKVKKYNNTNNISFFEGKTFQLEYFLKNGLREDLKFYEGESPLPPNIDFITSEISNQLNANFGGYCNVTGAIYKVEDGFLEVLERGGTTLRQCAGDEEMDVFNPITGNIYMQQPAKKVYYQIKDDENGLWLWSDENHKLFFSEKVLSIEENELEKAVNIFPSPAKDKIYIELKSTLIKITDISILDFQGRIILKKTSDFNNFNISKLARGIYFINVKTENNSSILKKIILE